MLCQRVLYAINLGAVMVSTGGGDCGTIYEPVCGADGQTWGNPCVARSANVIVAAQGRCPPCTGSKGGAACICCEVLIARRIAVRFVIVCQMCENLHMKYLSNHFGKELLQLLPEAFERDQYR